MQGQNWKHLGNLTKSHSHQRDCPQTNDPWAIRIYLFPRLAPRIPLHLDASQPPRFRDNNRPIPNKVTAMDQLVRDILGYLNFSSGKPDTKFQRNINDLMHSAAVVSDLSIVLTNAVESLEGTEPTFADITQAREVVRLTLDETFPAYIRHHGDILFHLEPLELDQPFLLAKMFEAVVAQGGPWNETQRVVDGALACRTSVEEAD